MISMTSSANSNSADSKTLQRLVSGNFEFHANLPISSVSKFSDEKWTWVDRSNERLECYTPDRLTINWEKILMDYKLPENIVSDLKRYAFV